MPDDKPTTAEQRAAAVLLPGSVIKPEAEKKSKRAAPDSRVESLQNRLGVAPDGIVGPATLKAAGGDILIVHNLTTSCVTLSPSFLIKPSGTVVVGKSELENNAWLIDFVRRGIIRIVSSYERPAYELDFADEG